MTPGFCSKRPPEKIEKETLSHHVSIASIITIPIHFHVSYIIIKEMSFRHEYDKSCMKRICALFCIYCKHACQIAMRILFNKKLRRRRRWSRSWRWGPAPASAPALAGLQINLELQLELVLVLHTEGNVDR